MEATAKRDDWRTPEPPRVEDWRAPEPPGVEEAVAEAAAEGSHVDWQVGQSRRMKSAASTPDEGELQQPESWLPEVYRVTIARMSNSARIAGV